MQIVLRPKNFEIDETRMGVLIEKILLTTYISGSQDHDAPEKTDCMTAIRYILRYSSNFVLPHAYIGDIPRILIEEAICSIMPLGQAQCGDLVFFEKMSKTHKKYMVYHVGLVLNKQSFIHSSKKENGKISSLNDIFYNANILDDSFLIDCHDPRNHYA